MLLSMLSHKRLLINIFNQNIKVRGLYCSSIMVGNSASIIEKYYNNHTVANIPMGIPEAFENKTTIKTDV